MSIKSLYPDTRPSLNLDFANTKVLDPRITFARASTATFYDGKTVSKAEENLALQSQGFNTGVWQNIGFTSVTGSQTAPDGTSTAFAFTETTANDTHRSFQSINFNANQVYTISFFAKYANRRYVQLNADSVRTGCRVIFDIQNGTVTDSSSTISTSVGNYGNGWYRCIATLTCNTSSGNKTFPIGGNNGSTGNVETYTGNGLLAYYLWGVQVEERSGVTAYTPTTNQPIVKYQPTLLTAPIGTPRFDHNPTTRESLGLLLEEQRTNLRTNSENFTLWGTGGDRVTIVANTSISPAGTLTANSYLEQANQKSWRWQEWASSFTSGQAYTLSCFVKPGTASFGVLMFLGDNGVFNGLTAVFDLNTGTVSSVGQNITANITSHGNGWYRISATQTAAATTAGYLAIGFTYSANFQTSPTGNAFNTLGYVWGAQVEAGSFATSYIPTSGSQVTRSADSAEITGTNFSSWYRIDEGTFYADVARISLAPGSIQSVFGTNVNYSDLALGSGGANFRFGTGAGIDLNLSSAATIAKYAASYESNTSHYLSVNGDAAGTRTQTTALPNSTALFLGKGDGTSSTFPFNGWFKKFSYYPKRLSNTQLQALTQL